MASTAVPNGDLTFLAQWSALRAWIGALTADELDRPSTLDGWSVADLVAHLSGTCNSIAALRPAPQTSEPLTIAGYLVIGPYFTLGWIAKGVEVVLIVLVTVDIFRVYGSPMGLVRAALDSVAPILPERFRPTAA